MVEGRGAWRLVRQERGMGWGWGQNPDHGPEGLNRGGRFFPQIQKHDKSENTDRT